MFNNLKKYDIKLIKSYDNQKYIDNIGIPNVFFLYKMQAFYVLEYDPKDYDTIVGLNDLFMNDCGPEHHNNPGIMLKFLNKFKPINVLDYSVDRKYADNLLGHLAYGKGKYTAASFDEPTECEYKKHNEMILAFGKDNNNYLLSNSNSNYGSDFDFIYVNGKSFKSMDKLVDKLIIGGHIINYIDSINDVENIVKHMMYSKNIYYQGCIFYKHNDYKPMLIYKKSLDVPEKLYNPKPKIRSISDRIGKYEVKFNVVCDNYIIGGTKVRAGLPYFRGVLEDNKNVTSMTYIGASNGYAQVAIAYCLYLLKRPDIQLILFIQKEYKELQTMTLFYHSNTKYILVKERMGKLYEAANEYKSATCFEIPFGFHFDEYEKLLYNGLSKYVDDLINIKRMWLVVGSGTVLNVLQKLLPNTHFLGVQVGKKVWDDQIYDIKRFTLYVSSYKLYENYKHKVNYDTVQSYDAKVWEFIKGKGFGREGDYIWNVAGSHNYL